MKEEIKALLEGAKIEYCEALSYSDVSEINSRLMARAGFIPKSVIVFLVPYYGGETENLSRYAASLDYHVVIKSLTEKIISGLKEMFPTASFIGYGDHSPINERHAALIAGLGIAGDNGLIVNESYGSYVFIGDIISDLAPQALGAISPLTVKACEHCGACRRACPTGILRGEGKDCLSAITQRKGELTEDEIALMRKFNTVWGCDICQSSCPHNKAPKLTSITMFYEDRITCLTKESLNNMTEEEFSRRAFAWRGRAVLERNLDKIN